MDVFYEESSVAQNSIKEGRKYKLFNVIAIVFLSLGILGLILAFAIIPMSMIVGWLIFIAWFFVGWFAFTRIRNRYNVNYDYTFVSGELRITRVFNVNKRKPLARIQAEEIVQMGDVESEEYDRLAGVPDTKKVICTSNVQAAEGKFFLYLLVASNGEKKLYVLECRETLLTHILRFVNRTVLERGYIPQEKKQR